MNAFFSWYIALARTFSPVSSVVVRRGNLVLFWILEGEESLHIFTIKCVVSYRLLIDALYQIENIPFYPYLAMSFYHEWVLSFVKFLMQLLRWLYAFCVLFLWLITFDCFFQMLKQPCIFRIHLTWLWCIIVSDIDGIFLVGKF